MAVITYCCIGCEDEVTTWYYSTQLIELVNTYDLGVVSYIQRIGCQTEKNVYLTLTDPLRIQSWSQDRRNQTKSNRKQKKIRTRLDLYTYINRQVGTPEKQRKQKHCSTSSNIVVIIYFYIGCENVVTTWYYSIHS